MSKIYVVTEGQYSEYSIIGVFSTRKKAKLAGDRLYKDYTIEVYKLDELVNLFEQGYTLYSIHISMNGDIKRIDEASGYTYHEHLSDNVVHPVRDKTMCWTYCKAKSKEEAIKIAGERLARYKAKEGIA